MKVLKMVSLFVAGLCFSQEYLFTYETKFKTDSLAENHSVAEYTLDIGKKEIKFYPTEVLDKDSIFKKTGNYSFLSDNLDYFEHRLKRKVGSNEYINYHSKSPLYYAVKTNDEPQKWKIENDTKTIGDYKVRKAVADFGGRSWVAWFTEDIAIPEGPYKFRGLPGLILEVYDTKANFLFQLKEVKKKTQPVDTQYFLENLYEVKPLSITEKQWHKLNLDYYANPAKDFQGGVVYVQRPGDDKPVAVKLDTREMTERAQKLIKKHNNPIELNKAIVYPK